MTNRTTGIVLIIVSIALFGMPGLCLCLFGGLTAIGVMPLPIYFTLNGETTHGTLPTTWGFAALCLALFLIAIPIVVGILTLRNKSAAGAPQPPPSGPLPPAI
jgi:hypothetical protein